YKVVVNDRNIYFINLYFSSFQPSLIEVKQSPKRCDVLLPTLSQPGTLANFVVRLSEQKVLLESCQASVEDSVTVLMGEVKIVNVSFHKSVWIRYSYDGWDSFAEIQANVYIFA
ncbi:Glycogen-binding subunit 76A, partial [Folsomia candida]